MNLIIFQSRKSLLRIAVTDLRDCHPHRFHLLGAGKLLGFWNTSTMPKELFSVSDDRWRMWPIRASPWGKA